MTMFATMQDVRKHNAETGHYWFTPGAMRFFSSRVVGQDLIRGRFFISSERNGDAPRGYTVRAAMSDGSIETVGEFQAYRTPAAARAAASRVGIVTVHETRFLEEDIVDGDYPRDDVTTAETACEDVAEAVALISRYFLSFAASGGSWAADPDGSYVTNYATGERVETSAHLDGWTASAEREIKDSVG